MANQSWPGKMIFNVYKRSAWDSYHGGDMGIINNFTYLLPLLSTFSMLWISDQKLKRKMPYIKILLELVMVEKNNTKWTLSVTF